MKCLVLFAAMLLCPVVLAAETGSRREAGSSVLDPPLRTERIKGAAVRGQKNELTCLYFATLRVKQLDLGEVGAGQLAILPLGAGGKRIPCQKGRAPGEIIVPSASWSGYFKGVKSDYVFFDAEDGTNGGLGFAVFDGRDGRKLFDDLAVGGIGAIASVENGIRLKYRRAVVGACSILSEGASCWSQIRQHMAGVKAEPVPDCASGYLKAKSAMARDRCAAQNDRSEPCFQKEMRGLDDQHWDQAPSVIAYDVEAIIQRSGNTIEGVTDELSCWPAD